MLRTGRRSFLSHEKRRCLRKNLVLLRMARSSGRWMLPSRLPPSKLRIGGRAMRRLLVILRKPHHSIPSIPDNASSLQIHDHGIFHIQSPHVAEGIHGERSGCSGTRSLGIARILGVVRLEGRRASGGREAVEIREGCVGWSMKGSVLCGHFCVLRGCAWRY